MASVADAAPGERVNSERLLLWTLLVVYIFNFLDRQIVTILAEPIKRDLGLSDTQLGLMTGLAFALFYALLGIPIARYADRPGSNRVGLISVSLVLWSGMTALCGMTQNFTQLLLARVGVGVGRGRVYAGGAFADFSDMVPMERRSSAIAFYGMGIPIGSLLGLMMGGYLADTVGWRQAFLVVGAPGLLLAAFVWFVLRDPRRGRGGDGGARGSAAVAASCLPRQRWPRCWAAGRSCFWRSRPGWWRSSAMARACGRRSISCDHTGCRQHRSGCGAGWCWVFRGCSAPGPAAGWRIVSASVTGATCCRGRRSAW